MSPLCVNMTAAVMTLSQLVQPPGRHYRQHLSPIRRTATSTGLQQIAIHNLLQKMQTLNGRAAGLLGPRVRILQRA